MLWLKWPDFASRLTNIYTLRASASDYVLLYLSATVIIAIHELGHGFTCKYFGGEVHEIGAMMFYFEPRVLLQRERRLDLSGAEVAAVGHRGGVLDPDVLASLAAVVWWAAEPGTLISDASLAVF